MLSFSIAEFALIIGLKCVGEVDPSYFVDTADTSYTLRELNFSSLSILREEMQCLCLGIIFFSSDDDAVKIAMFFLVSCFFLASKSKDKCISTEYPI